MKRILNIIFVSAVAIGLSSCNKDFLNQTPTEDISAEDLAKAVEQDPALLAGNVAGLYTTMFETGTGGTTGHDDFGQKGYDIYMDMVSSDMALLGVNYGWYSGIARYTSVVNYTTNQVYMPWRYYYRIIFAANTVIDALGGTDAVPEATESKRYMGQAKAMRAYAYFYLANMYSREVYGTGQELILPIYTNTEVPNQPLSTSAEVFDLIVSDLEDAITLLDGFSRGSKEQVNSYVAKGLLAYALAARGDNADLTRVVTLTEDIINNGGFSLTPVDYLVARLDADGNLINSEAGFNDVASPSWMWGMDLTDVHGLNLVSWWGQIDLFTYSYASVGDPKAIDKALYDLIPADDIRKGQFDPAEDLAPINKFFAPARTFGGTRYATMDYVYMRVEEMYLLNAEAHARLNADGPAQLRLKEMLANRVADVSYIDGLSGQALRDEIHLQTRIEMWGEGKSYLSLKRNKMSVTRGDNHLFEDGKTFQYNSPELTFPIPESEVLNNPNLN